MKSSLCRCLAALSLAAALPWTGQAAQQPAAVPATGKPDSHYAEPQLSNHALIITVSEYQKSPLPGVLTDRKLGIELAQRLGVPPENIVELSEQQVTRDGLKQAFADMNQSIMPGDKLYVYFSGHGARYFSKLTNQCTESLVMQDMHVVTNAEFASMIRPLSAKADKTIVMLDSCHSGGVAAAAGSRSLPNSMRAKFSPEASSPQQFAGGQSGQLHPQSKASTCIPPITTW